MSSGPVRKVTVITPCLNAEDLIGRTAESLMNQTAVNAGAVQLQYLVCDGASSDRTVEIVREICGDRAEIRSEKDGGMYEALAGGLRRATGDVVSYLNAGDYYSPHALEVVAEVLSENPRIDWLMGLHVVYNDRGQIIRAHIPFRCRRRLLRKGLLYKLTPYGVQQESTFWRREMVDLVDLDALASFRLAGDTYMWQQFAARSEPAMVETYLGGWTRHEGQLSAVMSEYLAEFDPYRGAVGPFDLAAAGFDLIAGLAPPRLRKVIEGRRLLRYSMDRERWL